MLLRGGFFMSAVSFLISVLTDYILPVFLPGAGIYLTIKSRFVQIRCFKESIKNTFGSLFSKRDKNKISPFASLMTSLAAQLGTGNIVGAGSAIITGGPGAIFWMWVSAFFGMAVAYYEAVLAQKTKKLLSDGTVTGGAAYYIREAFDGKKGKILSLAFSFFASVALGLTGAAVQSNSIAVSLKEAFGIPGVLSGILITLAAAFVILKGTKAVTRLSERLVPVMGLLYIFMCIAVITVNRDKVLESVGLIFKGAFSPDSLFGGITGITLKDAVSQGVKRGLFTNEAGMGSTASAHALSDAPSPHFQGTLGMAGVFIDTFLMLGITAVAIISVLYTGEQPPDSSLSGSLAVVLTFSRITSERWASAFVAVSVLLFAFASILGWNLSGCSSAAFLFGEKSKRLYLLSSLMFVFIGCIIPAPVIWHITDIFNAMMVLTNVPAVIKIGGNPKNTELIYKSDKNFQKARISP